MPGGFQAGFSRGPTGWRGEAPPSPSSASPSMRFLSMGSQFTLKASFPHSVTLIPLRYTSLVATSSSQGFHPQACALAGRTTKKALLKLGLFEPTRAVTQPCLRRRERPRAAKLRPTSTNVAGSGTSLLCGESLIKFQVMRSCASGGFEQPGEPQYQPVGPVW